VHLFGPEDRLRERRLTVSLSDPAGGSVIAAALAWLQGTLLGTIATTLAIVAVSWVGLLMLAGRLDIRRGMTVIAGCFVLFGASSIAAGIRAFIGDGDHAAIAALPPAPPVPQPPPPPPRNADPYAGAAVPRP
jgi:type IV secretory pathway VirB2 component (pilin)